MNKSWTVNIAGRLDLDVCTCVSVLDIVCLCTKRRKQALTAIWKGAQWEGGLDYSSTRCRR